MTHVALVFRLDEEVTPAHFALRVAEACFANGALRVGEAVVLPDGSGRELVDDGSPVGLRIGPKP